MDRVKINVPSGSSLRSKVVSAGPRDPVDPRALRLSEENLFDIARALLAVALAGESFLRAAFFAWFQVERVSLDFFNDVFLLDLALEAAQGTFKSFAILEMDFCQ